MPADYWVVSDGVGMQNSECRVKFMDFWCSNVSSDRWSGNYALKWIPIIDMREWE